MVAQNTVAKQAYALITLYIQSFEKKYQRKPQVNRYREKWGFIDMIEDLGYDQAREVVEYYLRTAKQGHPVPFLLQNYDKINEFMEEKKKDEENRIELRKQTEARVRELENKSGEHGTQGN